MSHSPTRRPIKLRPKLSHIVGFLNSHGNEIELGWSYLTEELNDAGWPDQTPEDDRKPRRPSEPGEESDVLDYADPTGEIASGKLNRLHRDREELEDMRWRIEGLLRDMERIARRHRPPATPAVPACSLTTCNDPVEQRRLGSGLPSYVGMIQVAGIWVAKPGVKPVCARHRKQEARRAS